MTRTPVHDPGVLQGVHAFDDASPEQRRRAHVLTLGQTLSGLLAPELFADLYQEALEHPGVIVCVARHGDGDLAGLGYGYRWLWSERADPWSQDLRARLADAAAERLDGAFAVVTLAVDPAHQGRGSGSSLLKSVADSSACSRAWLVTEKVDSPALRPYEARGWTELGSGPPTRDHQTMVLARDTGVSATSAAT